MPLLGLALVLCLGFGCKKEGAAKSTLERLSEKPMMFSQCPPEGAKLEQLDANGDKSADVVHAMVGGARVCTALDLDFDGRVDVMRFYEKDGRTVAREEQDFDFDGRVDQISLYERGQLRRKELDTNFDGKMDARIGCEGGRVTKVIRDRRNDGFADTWETYAMGQLAEIRYDVNGNGVPELAEIFQDGLLRELRYDDDGDGRFDRTTEVPMRDAGGKEEPLTCEVSVADISKAPPRIDKNADAPDMKIDTAGTLPGDEGSGEEAGNPTSSEDNPADAPRDLVDAQAKGGRTDGSSDAASTERPSETSGKAAGGQGGPGKQDAKAKDARATDGKGTAQ